MKNPNSYSNNTKNAWASIALFKGCTVSRDEEARELSVQCLATTIHQSKAGGSSVYSDVYDHLRSLRDNAQK